jgi:1,4-alpha-glucan branching enzyme
VAVAGTFNDWSVTSHPMMPDATRRRWTATVALPPGEHCSCVVDGAWVTPPQAADYVDDGFGARNGVVVVP